MLMYFDLLGKSLFYNHKRVLILPTLVETFRPTKIKILMFKFMLKISKSFGFFFVKSQLLLMAIFKILIF